MVCSWNHNSRFKLFRPASVFVKRILNWLHARLFKLMHGIILGRIVRDTVKQAWSRCKFATNLSCLGKVKPDRTIAG